MCMLLEKYWANELWNRCLRHYIGTEEGLLWRNRRFLCIVLNGPMSLTHPCPVGYSICLHVDWPDAIIFFLYSTFAQKSQWKEDTQIIQHKNKVWRLISGFWDKGDPLYCRKQLYSNPNEIEGQFECSVNESNGMFSVLQEPWLGFSTWQCAMQSNSWKCQNPMDVVLMHQSNNRCFIQQHLL